MKKYEYMVVYINPSKLIDELTVFGEKGWELITVFQGQSPIQYYFKREIG